MLDGLSLFMNKIDKVEVISLVHAPRSADQIAETIRETKCIAAIELNKIEIEEFRNLWNSLRFGEEYRCHRPYFAIRVNDGSAACITLTLSWDCNNIHIYVSDNMTACGSRIFNSETRDAQDLLKLCFSKFPDLNDWKKLPSILLEGKNPKKPSRSEHLKKFLDDD